MDTKEKVSVWAGILTLAVLQAINGAETEFAYSSDIGAAVGSLVGYGIGFVILYFVIQWLLSRYFKGRSSTPSPQAIPTFEKAK